MATKWLLTVVILHMNTRDTGSHLSKSSSQLRRPTESLQTVEHNHTHNKPCLRSAPLRPQNLCLSNAAVSVDTFLQLPDLGSLFCDGPMRFFVLAGGAFNDPFLNVGIC